MTHNIVNKYIANKASEDPAFPKQQFPPTSLCPQCKKQNEEFDAEATLNFMINYYGNLKIDGLRVSQFDFSVLLLLNNQQIFEI